MSFPHEILKKIGKKMAGRRLLLLLDFDGTLAPLRKQPELAVLSLASRRLLERLSAGSGISVAIVTGRDMQDIREKVGVSGIIYASNHGYAISGPGIRSQSRLPAECQTALKAVYTDFLRLEKAIPGARAERKAFSVVLHFRNAARLAEGRILETLTLMAEKYGQRGIVIRPGKKIYEAMPDIGTNKGTAVRAITAAIRAKTSDKAVFPVYIGDDFTDEDAFLAVNPVGVSVRVGKRTRSAAQFSLANISVVRKFIRLLPDVK